MTLTIFLYFSCSLISLHVVMMWIYLTICRFFFSSRRRHTRSLRDWSSDVCSSDLGNRKEEVLPTSMMQQKYGLYAHNREPIKLRSEERRVGKEGKTRRSREL